MLKLQDFIEMADKILSLKGKCQEGGHCYGPASVGGDFCSRYWCRSFKNKYVSITDFKEMFGDKSGNYRLMIYVNDKRNVLHDSLFLLGLYKGKLVLDIKNDIEQGKEIKQDIKTLDEVSLGRVLSWL